MEDAEELALLAASDFEQALRSHGAQEAAETLNSYVLELRGAPQAVLLQLAASFRQHATAMVAGGASHRLPAASRAGPALDLQPYAELQRLLLRVVAGCPQAEQEVHEVWSDGAAALLYGTSGEPAEVAVDRLRSCAALLPTLLAPGSLRRLPAPTDHQQRRSLLACLLHLRLARPPGLPAGALEELTAHAVPSWFGSDHAHAKQQMSAAFEAFAAVMQHPSVRQHGGSSGRHGGGRQHPPAAGGQAGAGQSSASTQEEALRFLQLIRAPLPAVTDLWWAHFAALLHSLVAAAQAGGSLVLRRTALQPLLHSLCCNETAHMVVQLLLAHPSYSGSSGSTDEPAAPAAPAGGRGRKRGGAAGRAGGREGGGKAGGSRKDGSPREALAMAAALLAHDVPAFLSGCCELLRPEANCPLTVRVEAIAAMDRAAGAYLDSHEGQEGASTSLWPPAALDHLLYALRSDPSIRVRRECMRLLRCVAVDVGSPQEAALLRAVVQRCRDRDDAVRQAAFALLVQFPQATLESRLSLGDWQTLLDVGLAGAPPSGSSAGPAAAAGGSGTLGGQAAAKHAAAIQEAAQHLLLRYLGLEGYGEQEEQQRQQGEAGRDFIPASDDEEGGSDAGMEDAFGGSAASGGDGASGSGTGSPAAWVTRLEALRTLPPHADSCPMAAHLAAAWHAALVALLSPEQQAAAGISVDATDSAAQQQFGEDGGDMWTE